MKLALTLCCLAFIFGSNNPNTMKAPDKNVFGETLQPCCTDPMTGYYRDGKCSTGPTDYGIHTVCAVMTEDFLSYTKKQGNDLSTPIPAYQFPGLKPGDGWCLCAARWKEAYLAGCAPQVNLHATHEKALTIVTLEMLQEHMVSPSE